MQISAVCSLGKRKKESGVMDLEALSTPPNRYTYIETQGTKIQSSFSRWRAVLRPLEQAH
jgi:hypothetical protein